MAQLNYYLISAALGATIGERLTTSIGPLTYQHMTRKMTRSLRERQPFVSQLRDEGSVDKRFVQRLKSALDVAREGFSPDRVIADPAMNEAFIERCRTFGLDNDVFTLNKSLLHFRKAGQLQGLGSKKTIVRAQWRFAYASEIAGRAVCLRYGTSIDTVLCHPKLVEQFDSIAGKLAADASVFERRWCALNIRKRGSAHVGLARKVLNRLRWSTRRQLQELTDIPEVPGICELFEEDRLLLVCESANLLQSAMAQGALAGLTILERDLWRPQRDKLFWRFSVTDTDGAPVPSIVTALVGKYSPVFNIPRAVRGHAA